LKDICSSGMNNWSLLRSSDAGNIMFFYKQRAPNGAYIPYEGFLFVINYTSAVVAYMFVN